MYFSSHYLPSPKTITILTSTSSFVYSYNHIKRILQYVLFYILILLLNIVSESHPYCWICQYFFYFHYHTIFLCRDIPYIFLIHSYCYGFFGGGQFLTIIKKAVTIFMNITVHVFWCKVHSLVMGIYLRVNSLDYRAWKVRTLLDTEHFHWIFFLK